MGNKRIEKDMKVAKADKTSKTIQETKKAAAVVAKVDTKSMKVDKKSKKEEVSKSKKSKKEESSSESESESEADSEDLSQESEDASESDAESVSEASGSEEEASEQDSEEESAEEEVAPVINNKRKAEATPQPEVKKAKDEDKSDRTLFVGHLNRDTTKEAIEEFFSECGQVEDVRIICDKNTGVSKGFCYLEFSDASSLNAALKLSGEELDGFKINVDKANAKTQKPASPASSTLFVGNLSFSLTEDSIYEFFGDQVTSVRMITDRETGNPKGFAYVEFASPAAATVAMSKNNEELGGRNLRLDFAAPRAPVENSRGRGRGGPRGGRGGRGGRGRF